MPTNPDPETEDEGVDTDDDDAGVNEEADRVISYLQEAAEYTPLVAVEFPNTVEDTVSAYAKIAGRTWSYFVRSSSVNIGRAPEKEVAASNDGNGFTPVNDNEMAHIDLGPSKLVSRLHAVVEYHQEQWRIEVKGRNGIRVNGQLLKRTHRHTLTSGDVIEIAGTEMMFVTPNVPVQIHEMYSSRVETQPAVAAGRREEPPPKRSRRNTTDRSSTQPQPSDFLPPTHVSPYPQPGQTQEPSPDSKRPTTPVRSHSLLSAPYLAQNANAGQQYENHMTIESNDQVDYASDAFKDVKPPMSYATLIAQAILSTQEGKLSLSGIYDWIQGNFAYYRHNDGGWQVSLSGLV